jgi:hypothetical protein
MMNEENMMDDETQPTTRSESAFSGMSNEDGRRHASNSKFPLTVKSKAYLVRSSGNVRFDLWKPSLENRSGVRFENGRMYVVRGTIIGVGGFESRHRGSTNLHVYVFVGGGTLKLVPGERYRLLVEAIEEKRRFVVLQSTRGPFIRVTKPVLEGLGVRTDEKSIMELQLRRPGREETRKVYAHWEPDWGFIQLFTTSAGFSVGEVVEVVEGRNYTLEAFVDDFQRHKSDELANVELGVGNGSPAARIAGREIPIGRFWLATHGLKAALNVELGFNHRIVKYEFDGNKVEARFANSDLILECRASGIGLDIAYARTSNQVYTTRLGQEIPDGNAAALKELNGGIMIIAGHLERDGLWQFEAKDSLISEVRTKLNGTKTIDEYRTVRGDIAEAVACRLFQETGLDVLADHPSAGLRQGMGCRRPGPDFLVRKRSDGNHLLVEVKWWENVKGATEQARNQVRKSLRRGFSRAGQAPVVGAYIAILDWKITKRGWLRIERVDA